MKALVYTGEKNLIYQDYSDPIKNKDEEIIKINSVGICGSDMHAFLGHDESCLLYTSDAADED